jgi:D-alanyl-D-alanine carboxypeptidase/D-alanyl-D-alanine-endopeptidase (penicillin-binding protein 4)
VGSSQYRRRGGALLVALACASIGSPDARSQEEVDDPAADPGIEIEIEIAPDDATAATPAAAPLPDPDDKDARNAWLQVRLGTLMGSHPPLRNARIGVSIVDLATGEELYGKDPTATFNLASNAKVITSAAALARLGPDFRWRTAAYAEVFDPLTGTIKGDLYVRGRGDPTLRVADLRALVHDLALAGVRAIQGKIVFDLTYFDGVVEPPHFDEQPKERAGFRAPVGALSVDGNSVVVVVEPDVAGVLPAAVTVEPAVGPYVQVTLADVATVTRGRTRIRVETLLKKDVIELQVTGQIRADQGPEWIRRRIDDPVRMASEVLKNALAAEGITLLKKKVGRGAVPEKAKLLAYHASPPLGDIVRTMNKLSNNFYAEALLKTLGAETGPAYAIPPRPATWEDGLAAVRAWLVLDVGLEAPAFRFGNGSGLFSSTAVSAAQMTQVLGAAWKDFRVGPDLVASLAVMGVDGTVRSRLARTPARGRARAKTGTLAAVSTLAGYVAVDSRRPLAFAIFVNGIPEGGRAHARRLQDEIVAACVAYLGGE